jgi:putative membrane protein
MVRRARPGSSVWESSGPYQPLRRNPLRPSRVPSLRRWIVAAYLAVVVASGVGARYPADWWLENLVVFAAAAGVAAAWRRFVFSDLSLLLLALFGALHAYGAHYTYSETPLGDALREALGLARNPYDRIVHFCFGLLLSYPLREVALRVLHVRGLWGWLLPLLGVLSLSASYELVESWTARLAAPELGTAFLGTQGDEWDAQKDMGAALAGALLALGGAALLRLLLGREPWRGLPQRDHVARNTVSASVKGESSSP